MSKWLFRVSWRGVLSALLTVLACGAAAVTWVLVFRWETDYSSRSPNDEAEVRVDVSRCFADCAVRIVVSRGWREWRVGSGRDCLVGFAHAAWDGERVGVYVDGVICGAVTGAFDLARGEAVGFEILEPAVRADITASYSVTAAELSSYQGDVFQWTTNAGKGRGNRATTEFRKRFPRWE